MIHNNSNEVPSIPDHFIQQEEIASSLRIAKKISEEENARVKKFTEDLMGFWRISLMTQSAQPPQCWKIIWISWDWRETSASIHTFQKMGTNLNFTAKNNKDITGLSRFVVSWQSQAMIECVSCHTNLKNTVWKVSCVIKHHGLPWILATLQPYQYSRAIAIPHCPLTIISDQGSFRGFLVLYRGLPQLHQA